MGHWRRRRQSYKSNGSLRLDNGHIPAATLHESNLETMHSFDFVCLGAGGGPVETDLSAYLLKPASSSWEDGIIAVEAGSGIGALRNILSSTRQAFHDLQASSNPHESHEMLASRLYSYIQTFLISHSHLDHVLSLVLSAGSLPQPPPLHNSPVKRRRIVGTRQVLDDLATMIFSDRIWPNLVSWSTEPSVPDFLYLYEPIEPHTGSSDEISSDGLDSTLRYHPISSMVSVLAMPISHGLCRSSHAHAPSGTYNSSAFFIRNVVTHKQFLFFGDVEPDSLAANPSTKHVWRVAASLITSTLPSGLKALDSIFIECSWPTTRGDKELYGHLNPQHLLHEMKVLASEVCRLQRAQQIQSPTSKPTTEELTPTPQPNNGEKPPYFYGFIKQQRRRTVTKRQSRSNAADCNASDVSIPTSSSVAIPASNVDVPIHPDPTSIKGSLKGVKLYVMHFKAPMELAAGIEHGKLSQHITSEFRALAEKEELGLEVIAMEQGMRVSI